MPALRMAFDIVARSTERFSDRALMLRPVCCDLIFICGWFCGRGVSGVQVLTDSIFDKRARGLELCSGWILKFRFLFSNERCPSFPRGWFVSFPVLQREAVPV